MTRDLVGAERLGGCGWRGAIMARTRSRLGSSANRVLAVRDRRTLEAAGHFWRRWDFSSVGVKRLTAARLDHKASRAEVRH
jgi:hypothetical protein